MSSELREYFFSFSTFIDRIEFEQAYKANILRLNECYKAVGTSALTSAYFSGSTIMKLLIN